MEMVSTTAEQSKIEGSGITEVPPVEGLENPLAEKDSEVPPAVTELSKEEALEKAYQLQAKRRQQRIAEESREEAERERNRILQTRAMQDQLTKQEVSNRKQVIEQIKKEKEAHAKERKRQEDLVKEEWQERFGTEYPEDSAAADETEALKGKSGRKLVAYWCNRLLTANKECNKDNLKKCLSCLKIYINNVIIHPSDQKYRKIKKSNEAFQTRVACFSGAIELLEAVGFKNEEGDFYIIQGSPDLFLLGCAMKYINLQLERI
ncbi:PUB domain-containing protein [Cardiosporidium cionae]|uniref:PUB domain-containing protein n=1 Tax=Cardiosporidium cionae TaxID=476202 RepID=A0A3Q8UBI1_9APIC|nr:peroxisomal biogenesis factor 14 [Cardiosporidium cionae]KAF8821149.1 PUB domain-containing protein [Cardiosporidium cionae]|eukprot:KAF8821149.1 PUB domain-containing protein [Cardiosporidium cionae]